MQNHICQDSESVNSCHCESLNPVWQILQKFAFIQSIFDLMVCFINNLINWSSLLFIVANLYLERGCRHCVKYKLTDWFHCHFLALELETESNFQHNIMNLSKYKFFYILTRKLESSDHVMFGKSTCEQKFECLHASDQIN